MNAGERTIQWLYNDQLKVDDKWAFRTPGGFRWWADQNAQTIEVVGQEAVPEAGTAHLVSVRTEFLRSVELNDRTLPVINAQHMAVASMAGLVYDPEHRLLTLCSLVPVTDENSGFLNPLLSVAAVLQIAEARFVAPGLAELLKAEEATSGHPVNGRRPKADEMAWIVQQLIAPAGEGPSRWPDQEFQDAVDEYMHEPPSLLATNGGAGFTVEFPFGGGSSLCQVMGGERHPGYGSGLLVVQSFHAPGMSEADGARLALTFNDMELTRGPFGYGFGSYAFRNATLHFDAFLPNALYRPGLLPVVYFSCARRAGMVAGLLTEREWTPESFTPSHTALYRGIELVEGSGLTQ